MEDSAIIALYWERNEKAIVQSKSAYGAYCFSVAYNILKSFEDSEECVIDTWTRAWSSIPPNKPDVLKMFFAKITRRLAFDRYRQRMSQKRGGETALVLDELSECIADTADVENAVIANELSDSINRFIASLPEREGDIFLRRYFFSEKISEISEAYGLKKENVSVILNRTRVKLREQLVKENYIYEQERPV